MSRILVATTSCGQVAGLAAGTAEVHVLFNNCFGDNAQRNALQMQTLLEA